MDLILDSVGGQAFGALFDHLAPLGLVVLYGALDGPPVDVLPAMRKHPGRSPALRLFSMHAFDDDPGPRPPIHERVPLAEAARAHALLEDGRVLGNLLLKP